MGNSRQERHALQEALVAEKVEEERVRMALADKIVMVVVDQIVRDIIRPGPVSEERECYNVAQELRDYGPVLAKLVNEVLKVAEDEELL